MTVFIATSWNKGAVSQQFVGLARELARRGHRAIVLVSGTFRGREDHDGNPAVFVWPSPRPVHVRDARFLFQLIRRFRPNCSISNFGSANLMLSIGALLRVPHRIAWYHTMFAANAGNANIPAWRFRALQLRKSLVYRAATHVVANSEAASLDVQEYFSVPARKCTVFHNSIPDPFEQASAAEARAENKIVCVSRLSPMKGQHTLIRALALLGRKDVHVTFVGEGPTLNELIELARDGGVSDQCNFFGLGSGADVVRELSSAAISVVPSLSEAFGLVNVESLALSTPLVVSATGGSVEIARDGIEALHFEPGNATALARQLARLLDDPELRSGLAKAGRRRFENMFEQTRAIRRLADWVEQLR